ncbi:glycosyltransferase family 39 protein [Taibaiella soli]|nr:glycosyltransferase family 39 protein [Taibaiella soli]
MTAKRLNIWCASCALIVLFTMIFFSPNQYISDEPFYINNLALFGNLGLGKDFLLHMTHQSPGPLYQVVLASFGTLCPVTPVSMRFLNGLLFLLLTGITYLFFKNRKEEDPAGAALILLSVPPLWGLAGVGLSELPAMMFFSLGLFLFYKSISKESNGFASYLLALLGGFCISLAIMGRAQFLMLLVTTPLLFLVKGKFKEIILFLVAAAAIPLYVFGLWKGLMPPAAQHIQRGTVYMHGFLALGYLAIITLIICHRWLLLPRRFYYLGIVLTVCACVVNILGHFIAYEPLQTVVHRLQISELMPGYKYVAPGMIVGAGSFFLIASCYRIWENRSDIWFVFFFLTGLALVATSIKITWVFSSRYVAQAIPVLLIPYARYISNNYISWLLRIAGIAFGIAGLWSYYHYRIL